MDSPYVRSFETMGQLFSYLKERNETATAALHDRQKTISFGSYTVGYAMDILIFGRVYDRERFFTDNAKFGDPEITAMEWRSIETDEANGRVFGEFFSVVEPDGELGSNHKLNLWPISADTFAEAESYKWEPRMFPDGLWNDVYESVVGLALHLQEVSQ